ncbi:uncharacterized protein LOC121404197 [Drosophila obscura]|uniref:uncharacterized protein LOC121404197 n=1 Tax=Drosophila obscura TaxID=7282 RepID=UPI001BB1862F|nr:uncharacterized protein LOC121404197 [Drosophila obscura]
MSKVHHTTKSRFQEQLDYDKLPSWSDCASQLNRRYQHLAAEESTRKITEVIGETVTVEIPQEDDQAIGPAPGSIAMFLLTDTSKMYRQVQVAEEDRNFQLILWREKANIDVQTYRLNTVTYGTASAPFLAIRCLVELAKVYAKSHPVASQVIANDFYVDDMLTGANSLEELGRIRQEVSEVLEAGGFMLAKWASNHPHLLSDSGQEKSLQFDPSASIKTLGIRWNPQTDLFHYQLDDSFDSLPPTKRNILAKILLQHLWRQKLDWDESVPMSLHTSWNRFKQNLFDLEKSLYFALSVLPIIPLSKYTDSLTHQVMPKSRVSPLKTKSIPRLELCAALLLSTLWSQVRLLLDKLVIESVNFWSDSQVTLYWLERDPATLATFVANRVAEIQELSSGVIWRHVPTDQNPADLVSRGTDVDGVELSPEMEKSEDKKSVAAHSVAKGQTNEVIELIGRCSSFQKLLRIMAYVNRFIQGGNRSQDVVVSAKELKVSFLRLVKVVQRCELGSEFLKLDRSEILSPHLQRLSPFIHTSELGGVTFRLIRVGGRLLHAEIPYDAKFPLLLSQKSQFVILFVGRRGLPEKVYSDNATNFVGASRVMEELHAAFQRDQDRLRTYAAQHGVEWCFIPPRAPHFGGLWEAAVKAAKQRLIRGVGNAKLTADELSTHLVEVEAILNSRPIASPVH